MVKNYYCSYWNSSCSNLYLLPFVLLLCTLEKSPAPSSLYLLTIDVPSVFSTVTDSTPSASALMWRAPVLAELTPICRCLSCPEEPKPDCSAPDAAWQVPNRGKDEFPAPADYAVVKPAQNTVGLLSLLKRHSASCSANSCSTCPPGLPHPFLQSCFLYSCSLACTVEWSYSILCIRPCICFWWTFYWNVDHTCFSNFQWALI